MTDSKYFTTTKKGEIFELKSELNNDKKEKKREAVKKVSISDITVYLFSNNFPFKTQQLSIFL
jgi:ACT domain-containing protein